MAWKQGLSPLYPFNLDNFSITLIQWYEAHLLSNKGFLREKLRALPEPSQESLWPWALQPGQH